MIYDKRKAWENVQLAPSDFPAAFRAVLPDLTEYLLPWRGMYILPGIAERLSPDLERVLLELGFYFARRRQCWTWTSRQAQAGCNPLVNVVQTVPAVVRTVPEMAWPGDGDLFSLDRGRIAAALADSRAAAEMIQNALSGAKL